MTDSVVLRVGAATDVGRVREGNEDGYLVKEPLFAVADGMGGHRAGEVASALALETLGKRLKKGLNEAAREANEAVFHKQEKDRSAAGMGTTLTAALIDGGSVRFAHVGDSRAYLLRHRKLSRLTQDHSLVQELIDEGQITQEQSLSHPQRSVLTRALGTESTIEVDEVTQDIERGDRLLLCTDGLTTMLDDVEIARVINGPNLADDPQATAKALVKAANDAGGFDNITVLVLDVVALQDSSKKDYGGGEAWQSAAPKRRLFGGRGKKPDPGSKDSK